MQVASDLLAEINSSLGTSSPSVSSRLEPAPKARRSSYVRRPSVRLHQRPGDTNRQTQSSLPQSRKASISSMSPVKLSPSRWKGLQKQLPTWLGEMKPAENNQIGAAAARISPNLASPELGFTGPDSRGSRGSTSGRRASASRPVDARMRSGSFLSAAMDQGSILENQLRRGSVRSSTAGGALTQRFADIVRQATKPAWLSGGDAALARSAPSPEVSRQMYAPQPPSAAQGAAQDLVAMINASLSSQAAAPQEISSPGTPVRQERRSSMVNSAKRSPMVQSRLAAGSAGPGSAELAEIEALLRPQVEAQDKPMHPLQQAVGGLLNSASTGQSRRPEPTIESNVRGSNVEGITDGVHDLSMPASPARARSNYDEMHWGKDALMESRALPEAHQHARRTPVTGQAAPQSVMHVPIVWHSPDTVYGGEASAWPALQHAERPLQKPVSKLLQRSYIEPATLADLRKKWLQKPSIPTDLLSPVDLRFGSAARELMRAIETWEDKERSSQAAFEQSMRMRFEGIGRGLPFVPAF